MPGDLVAKRHQKPWQTIEQNQCEQREGFDRIGSNQPNPRAGRRQTAQSIAARMPEPMPLPDSERACQVIRPPSRARWRRRPS